ncbi:hypothetical protein GCM10010149_68660 [Nonomuraea roseoviolacea subsp. roseoviolacea]
MIPIDRVTAERPYCSTPLWASGSYPARIWGIVRRLKAAGLIALADKGYVGADEGKKKPASQKTASSCMPNSTRCAPHLAAVEQRVPVSGQDDVRGFHRRLAGVVALGHPGSDEHVLGRAVSRAHPLPEQIGHRGAPRVGDSQAHNPPEALARWPAPARIRGQAEGRPPPRRRPHRGEPGLRPRPA